MGFKSYEEYRSSDLWSKIRSAVLSRDRWKCQYCRVDKKSKASQVHHLSYDEATMRGERIDTLASVCHTCHKVIEFDGEGKKRPFQKVKAMTPGRVQGIRQKIERSFLAKKKFRPAKRSKKNSLKVCQFCRKTEKKLKSGFCLSCCRKISPWLRSKSHQEIRSFLKLPR